MKSILIIKLSAFGDFVLSFGPFEAIRKTYPEAKITLLTTKPYKDMAEKSGWFDDIWVDGRAQLREIRRIRRLRKKLLSGQFDMVFDLQTSDRSSLYYHLMWPKKPQWCGIAKGCSHPHDNRNRNAMHTIERQKDQLAKTGVTWEGFPDLSWMKEDLSTFNLPDQYALLVAGGAFHRPDKRWPLEHYASLAHMLLEDGITPLLIGAGAEAEDNKKIAQKAPGSLDLTNQTSFFQIASLAFGARCAIGNDTGPMHVITQTGCSATVLYSQASDPALCGQRGADVSIHRVDDLKDLDPKTVWEDVRARIK